MSFKTDWEKFVSNIKASVVDAWQVDVNVYTGDITASVNKDNEIDWPAVKKESAKGTKAKVQLAVSGKVNLLDGDSDVFISNVPEVMEREIEYMDVFTERMREALDIRYKWFEALANLAKLSDAIPGL